eukprot:6391019-Prymnesium_polylepis.1
MVVAISCIGRLVVVYCIRRRRRRRRRRRIHVHVEGLTPSKSIGFESVVAAARQDGGVVRSAPGGQ